MPLKELIRINRAHRNVGAQEVGAVAGRARSEGSSRLITIHLPRGIRRGALVVALALVCLGCWAASAQAYVYWANSEAGTIARANLDGTGVDPSFISGADAPDGVAVNGQYVYWANYGCSGFSCVPAYGSGTIGRAKLDGTEVDQNFITGASGPQGVAVDGGHVYWTNYLTHSIGRASLNGSGPDQAFVEEEAGAPHLLAVDGGHLYWGDDWGEEGPEDGGVWRAGLGGTGIDESFISDANGPTGVAVDGSHIYWTDYTGVIGRANLDGSDPEPNFITGADGPNGIAVDGGHLYWANWGDETIGRANLDGSGVNESFACGGLHPEGVAVDAGGGAAGAASCAGGGGGGGGGGGSTPLGPAPTPVPTTGAPNTAIHSHPKAKVKTRKAKAKVRFSFAAGQVGATFRCALDKGKFKPCASPAIYKVKLGKHRFRVAAVGAGGTDPTPASFSFKVVRKKGHGASGGKSRRHR